MKMKKIFALFIAILAFVGASAQNYSVAQVRQRINSMTAHINTMSCNFVQTKKLHMLKSSVSSRGKMYYSKPNRLRWEYTSPYRYQFVMNGQTVTMRNARGTSRADVAQSKVFKEITRIMMSSVVGSCVNDSRDFKVALQGGGNNWHAVLTPRRNPLRQMFSSIIVYFDIRRSTVTAVRMTERNGDTTTINLTNVRTNIPINASVFNLR